MKVICDRSALLDAINTVSGAVAARSPRVQLSCIHLHAAKSGGVGELTLSATDAEIALRLKLSQVVVSEPGDALIPADKLRAIVSAEDQEPTLTIDADDQAAHIRGNAITNSRPMADPFCRSSRPCAATVARRR